MVLVVLARFIQETDILCMSGAQAYLALMYFITGMDEDQFNYVRRNSKASEREVTCCPDAFHYLLRSYATNNPIHTVNLALRNTKQKTCENELVYSTRMTKAL